MTTAAVTKEGGGGGDSGDGEKSLAAHEIAKIFPAQGHGVMSFEEYQTTYTASITDPNAYWSEQAIQRLDWFHPFSQPALQGNLDTGDVTWFAGGKLNMCYNAIDRHVKNGKANNVAMIFEGDEPTDIRQITFMELQYKICQIANALVSVGVQKGNVVTIYMPMIPELAMTMLACTRIGAIHSVVFAGFSAEALGQRIVAAKSTVLITADTGKRAGKIVPLKDICNAARQKLPEMEDYLHSVLVWEREYNPSSAYDNDGNIQMATTYKMQNKDIRMNVLVSKQRPYHAPVWMDAEDALFILYTSGSTGKPKGVVHTTGGYAVYTAATAQITFGLESGKSIFACVADCGWITGHSYVVYIYIMFRFAFACIDESVFALIYGYIRVCIIYLTPGLYVIISLSLSHTAMLSMAPC
jgi:acetyl-CoA synthetase